MKTTIAMCLAAIVLASGCGTAGITTPDGYAKKQHWGYDYMAVSTDANVVSLRVQPNEDDEKGTLDFWTEAARKHLTLSRGYTAREEGAFTSPHGPGRYILFTRDHKGIEHLYLMGLVVKGEDIFVMEAGGEKALFEPDVPKIVKAFATLE